jgi:AraC family transcriptional regulator of adaptative response/methylated-DNA-[protein]-cysteine methyltransferase
MLKQSTLVTPYGLMTALADETALYLLEFTHRKGLETEIKRVALGTNKMIIPGRTKITDLIESELQQYFAGSLKVFMTPLVFVGSSFQKVVWNKLQTIPFGQTVSYKEMASLIERPTAYRAVARANATNHLAVIIPCHRVVASAGGLGGYAAGVECKKWLLEHEGWPAT